MGSPMDVIDMAVAANALGSAFKASAGDGAWRVLLCPDGPEGDLLKKVVSITAPGTGRTACLPGGGRVSVAKPGDGVFGQGPRILSRAGWARKQAHLSSRMLISWGDTDQP
jgi:hypothetical protein